MGGMSKIMKYKAGFTLFEVLTVIAVIGVIVSLSPVSSGFYTHSCYEAVVNKITADMRRFRMRAICNNKTYHFRIYGEENVFKNDSDSKSDYIFYYTDNDSQEIIVYHGEYPACYTLYKNLNHVKITDDYYDRISFSGRGTACAGTIGLKSSDGSFKQIVVSQLGRIRVEK